MWVRLGGPWAHHGRVRRDLPSGTVTFLFTDIEGSTRLLHESGAAAYAEALADHRRILRAAFDAHGGVEVDTQGDAFFIAFQSAPEALEAAREAREALAHGPIRVRIGIHTGTPLLVEEGYVGVDVNRAARIAACGHGGQVLVSAATAALAGTGGMRDLGEHRLKDLSAPERIYQFGVGDFPPLRSLHQTNLPIPSTPFLGREKELADVVALSARADVRLLTLTGPGGTGKSRLAAQAAAELAPRYPDGVWWVPLAALRDPELVIDSAARILGANAGLAEHIGDRPTLLVFDNFEQVVGAATEVAAVLAACPGLDLLVTSREPLRISGEHEYPVPTLAHDEGVSLFLARARAVDPDFPLDDAVAGICRRLDYLPLALELAAARAKVLSSGQILQRLEKRLPLLTGGARDLPARQQTLRAAIEWSHDLLTPAEQRLFARLAVFRGGYTLEDAEAVTENDLDGLSSLVDKSLLRRRDERFWMLETIREYATERLELSGDADETRRRHATRFLALAEEGERHLGGRETTGWLDRLDLEHDNFRAALDRFEDLGDGRSATRLTGALFTFWFMRGHGAEARRRASYALSADTDPTAERAKVLNAAAGLALDAADPASAMVHAAEAQRIFREVGDPAGAAYATLRSAQAALDAGDPAAACVLAEQSVTLFRDIGDADRVRLAIHELGWMTLCAGDIAGARTIHEQNLERAREAGDRQVESASLQQLGLIEIFDGSPLDGLASLEKSYEIDRALAYPFGISFDLDYLAAAAAARGRLELAAQLFGRAEALRSEVGARIRLADAAINERTLAVIRERLGEEGLRAAWEAGRSLSVDEAIALGLAR